jgi:hypothetical protein
MYFLKRFKINNIIKKIKVLQQSRALNQPWNEAIAKEIALYHQQEAIYISLHGNKNCPHAREMLLAVYRASSMLDDTRAQYLLGKTLLEEGKFRDTLQREGVFASDSNERQMQERYVDAHAFLLAAMNSNHILARRLHGLSYINGWGVPVDKDKGFELIVQSIEQENSWDKVPQIFKEIGLNKPEFFSALVSRRNKS